MAPGSGRVWLRTEVLELGEALRAKVGEGLSLHWFLRETGIPQRVVYELFGSWPRLRVELGLLPVCRREEGGGRRSRGRFLGLSQGRASREELQRWLTQMTEGAGLVVDKAGYLAVTGVSATNVGCEFGSWGELQVSVGLRRRGGPRPRHGVREMLEELVRVWRLVGRPPTYREYVAAGGRISADSIRRRFGGWRGAREQVRAWVGVPEGV